ncbi:hypothetical protein [Parabacteroides sp.]
MILDDRPHKLQYLVTTPGYEDDNGDYHQDESHYEGDIPCRHVTNGKAGEREFEDGVVRTYSAIIRLDADCREFSIGDKVRLSLLGGIEREYEVKGFNRNQMYARLWV